jgi:dodecin
VARSPVDLSEGRIPVKDHVYRIIEIAGSSEKSIEDAIHTAVARASSTLKHLPWFELVQTRGHIEGRQVQHYQVILKVGFTLEEA